jgi:hypothetical protein
MFIQLRHVSVKLSITMQDNSDSDTILGTNASPVYSVTTQPIPVEVINSKHILFTNLSFLVLQLYYQ